MGAWVAATGVALGCGWREFSRAGMAVTMLACPSAVYVLYLVRRFARPSGSRLAAAALLLTALVMAGDGVAQLIARAVFQYRVDHDARYSIYVNGWLRDKAYLNLMDEIGRHVAAGDLGCLTPGKTTRALGMRVHADARGLRRELPQPDPAAAASARTVIFLGGSTVFGMTIAPTDLPLPDMVERRLNARAGGAAFVVRNAGIPGAGIGHTKDYVLQFRPFAPAYTVYYEAVNTLPVRRAAPWRNSFLLTAVGRRRAKREALRAVEFYNAASYRQGLRDFVANSRALGAVPVLATYSLAYTEQATARELAYWDVLQNGMPSAYALAVLVRKHNAALRSVARGLKVPLVDSVPLLDGRAEYFLDSCHLNQAGNEVLAELVADALATQEATRPPRPDA
jgi:lysophospholipase L1-like esterase